MCHYAQGHIYAGSDLGAAQVPLATCGRSLTCMDCVLARDPYCGWDAAAGKCSLVSASQRYCSSQPNMHAVVTLVTPV